MTGDDLLTELLERRAIESAPMHSAAPMVHLDRVAKSFIEGGRERTVLHELTASFGAGEFVALVGKSGSGKSTLLNLVSGIDTPSAGDVWVNGQNITRLGERERTLFRRSSIGFIFQFYNLVPTLTVLENLLLPLELNGLNKPSERSRASELLDYVGLADRAATYPDKLSGGEQQRVAVARALVHDPLLVLADEPTGNLDEETGGRVLGLLDTLTRRAGKTLLMVTHSPDVAAMADRVFRMAEGTITVDRDAK